MRMTILTAVLALAAALAGAIPAAAEYPDRPIEMIITFPPGGPTDIAARVIQPSFGKALNVPVVLVNKGGSGGAVAMDAVAKAKPDGYTIAATVRSTISITPAVQANVPYRLNDFEMIGTYAASPQALVVRKDSPWKTLEELVNAVKAAPAKYSYGSAGQGTNSHLAMELLKLARGLDMAHVPFQGSGPLKNAILGGHVPVGSVSLSTMLSLVKSGDVIALLISGDKRNPALPDVPTMADKGVPEASLSTTMELYAPAKTPKPVVSRLAQALAVAMKNPETVAALEKAGLEPYYQPPDVSRQQVERETDVVLAAAKKLGLAK